MANKIDDKYKKLLDRDSISQATFSKVKQLVRIYQESDYSDATKKQLLEIWPYLHAICSNDSSATLYRGMMFSAKNKREYLTLLKKVISSKSIKTNTIRSWSLDKDIAEGFAYGYPDDYLTGRYSMVISCKVLPNEAVDLPDFVGLNENEYLLPPGTFSVSLVSAAIYSSDLLSVLTFGKISRMYVKTLSEKMMYNHLAKEEADAMDVYNASIFLDRLEEYMV